MSDKVSIVFAKEWCLRLINLCKNESTKNALQIIEKYFSSIDEIPKFSETRTKRIAVVHEKLLAVHQSPLINDHDLVDTLELASCRIEKTVQIILKPDEKLVSKPDQILLTVLSNFYSCFANLFVIISCPILDVKTTETVPNNEQNLLEELLITARDDVIMQLIEENMSYDDYFNQEVLTCLLVGRYDESDCVKKTFDVIKRIEQKFKLPDNRLIKLITGDNNTHISYNPTMANSLQDYVRLCDKEKKELSVFNFVIYAKLNCKVEDEYFSILFKSYTEKVRQGTIGFIEKQAVSI
jgi:hypothetical protein